MNHIHDFIEFMQKGRPIPEWDFTTYMLNACRSSHLAACSL